MSLKQSEPTMECQTNARPLDGSRKAAERLACETNGRPPRWAAASLIRPVCPQAFQKCRSGGPTTPAFLAICAAKAIVPQHVVYES